MRRREFTTELPLRSKSDVERRAELERRLAEVSPDTYEGLRTLLLGNDADSD